MADHARFIGRSERQADIADARGATALAALLDHRDPPWREGMLPPLGHWLCFPPLALQSDIGVDGHPVRTEDGLLPAADLPRRMWAGSRVRFIADVPIGGVITRTSTLLAATPKAGRSGPLLFATVGHRIVLADGSVAIEEEQDIVYREAVPAGTPFERPIAEAGAAGDDRRDVIPDEVMLLRYSALTFNGHRIHYDRPYATGVEGYPGLVVHGPLIATLLLDHWQRRHPRAVPASFAFRALSPVFAGETITLAHDDTPGEARLAAIGPGGLAMRASVGSHPLPDEGA